MRRLPVAAAIGRLTGWQRTFLACFVAGTVAGAGFYVPAGQGFVAAVLAGVPGALFVASLASEDGP